MSVIVQSTVGWLLDHWDFLVLNVKQRQNSETQAALTSDNTQLDQNEIERKENSESTCENVKTNLKCDISSKNISGCMRYKLKKDLFRIFTPFKMDSQCNADVASSNETSFGRKRKKRRKESLNSGEELADKFHKEIQGTILSAYNCLLQAARQANYIESSSFLGNTDNNAAARTAANCRGPGDAGDGFCEVCWETRHLKRSGEDILFIPENGYMLHSMHEVCNRLCRNDNNSSTILTIDSQKYLIPHNSSFIMSDVSTFSSFSKDLGQYDLIVLDPPWLNKSVKRKKTYFSLQNDVLLTMPVDSLMKSDCVIVVWVTNRCKHIDFVKSQFFKKFNITYQAMWFWLKITKSGEMVYDINSDHKKPYETLVIGKYHHGNTSHEKDQVCMEERKVIVSVPCSLHSKKPPLLDVLKDYLPQNPKCLELFARNLLHDWTSWGNEVLVHQHEDFYEEVS